MADASASTAKAIAVNRRPARRAASAGLRARAVPSVTVSEKPTTGFFRHRLLPTLGAVDAATVAQVVEQLTAAELPALLLTDPLLTDPLTLAGKALLASRASRPEWQLGLSVAERASLTAPPSLPVDFVCGRGALLPAGDGARVAPCHVPLCSSLRQVPRFLETAREYVAIRPTDLAADLRLLRAMAQQAPALQVLVLGAVARHDAPLYLQQRNVAAVCAPWIFSPELIRRQQWQQIRQYAQAAARLCN